jgi:Spy/CpxP family protein refolding chaperone
MHGRVATTGGASRQTRALMPLVKTLETFSPMNFRRVMWMALPFAFSAVACQSSSGGADASPTASAIPSAPTASSAPVASISPSAAAASASAAAFMAKGATRRHVGLAGVLLRGAYDLNLTDEQKATLEKLEDTLAAEPATTPWAAMKTYQMDLVAGIRADKLDNTKLQADYAAIDKAVAAAQGREADALNGLYAALDATQRQALVDQLKARRAAHEARERPLVGPDGGVVDPTRRRLDRLTMELALDDTQKKAVGALLARDSTMTTAGIAARRAAYRKRVDDLLGEFTKDTFDAKKVDLTTGAKTPHDAAAHGASFTSGLLGILHPDQREKLAMRAERASNRPSRNYEDVDSAFGGGLDEEPMGPRMR